MSDHHVPLKIEGDKVVEVGDKRSYPDTSGLRQIVVDGGKMRGLVMAAAAASLIGGIDATAYDNRRPAKRKRKRIQADRSQKQFLLKGVRP